MRSSAVRPTRQAGAVSATSTSRSSSRPSSPTSCRRTARGHRRHVELVRLPVPTTTASTPPARRPIIWNGLRRRTTAVLDRQRRPGYGTAHRRRPATGINVGASTQFGGTGWDSIKHDSQVATTTSSPGPTAARHDRRQRGVDVVADGAYSAGDATLNTILDGQIAWETWGGTSRSTPVAAGAAALVYQAWRQAIGPIPDRLRPARPGTILKSSAEDLGYDSLTQGAGSVDAAGAVHARARDRGAVVTPTSGGRRLPRRRVRGLPERPVARARATRQTFDLDGRGHVPDLRPVPPNGRRASPSLTTARRSRRRARTTSTRPTT